jgi:hypothetical protein
LPGDALATIQFQNPARDVVQKISVMGNRDDRSRITLQVMFEPSDRLRIEVIRRLVLAGVDKEFGGEAAVSPGYTVGYLEQEPLIDDARTVREVVEEAVEETVHLLKEFEEIIN